MSPPSISAASARRRYQEELVPSRNKRSERADQEESRRERRIERREQRRADRRKPDSPTDDSPPASTQPVEQPTPTPSPQGSLAERYVAQYEAQSGYSLSSDQRSAKVKQIEEFYGEASRQGRLEKIVFA